MPPRPRPRPVPKPTSSSNNGSGVAGSSSRVASGSGSSPTEQTANKFRDIVVNDTDEMFMKNRNRSAKTWEKLEKINKEVPKQTSDSGESDGERDDNLTPRRRKRQKKEINVVPTWQRTPDFKRMISVELTDDSDEDEVQILGDSSTPTTDRHGKRKRLRSRSRSITPPPAIPEHQLQNAKNVVRQALRGAVRPPSPTIDLDDSSDNLELQPEFRWLAERVRKEGHRGSSAAPDAAGAEDEVTLTVKWLSHLSDAEDKETEWQYKINRTDNFRQLFEAVAEDAQILTDKLVLMYRNKRFFSSITCQTLAIWSSTAEFTACHQDTYEHMQKAQKAAYSQPPVRPSGSRTGAGSANGPIDLDSDSDEDNASYPSVPSSFSQSHTQTQTQESDAESEAEPGDKFKITLRSALTPGKDITVIVRPSVKCGSIVKNFLRKAGLDKQYPEVFGGPAKGKKRDPRLCVDGDKLGNDTEIGNADVEDGDKVDIVGL